MSATEDLRQRGNSLFAAKDYAAALALYEEALAADPQSVDLHNNIAAAQHALQRYDAALASAGRSLAVRENSKAHSRMGAAQWALGRLPEALRSYERAAALAPEAAGPREASAQLRQLLSRAAGGSVAVPPRAAGLPGAAADALVAALAALVAAGVFFAPRLAAAAWPLLLVAAAARALLVAAPRGLLRADRNVVATWTEHRCTLEALLCAAALVTAAPPQVLLACALGLYAATSLAANGEAVARAPALDKLATKETAILLYAATLEALMLFTSVLTGGPFFTLIYSQYIKNIYRTDRNVRFAFTAFRMNVSRLTRHPYMPAVVDIYMQKFCDFLYTLSQHGH